MEWHAGLDGHFDADPATFYVAGFTERESSIEVDPSSSGWAVTTRSKARHPFRILITPSPMNYEWWQKHTMNLNLQSSPYLEFVESWDDKVFTKYSKGRALKPQSAAIRACVGESRPKLLYRVVHGKHPGDGLQSRGFPNIETDWLSFMLLFVHHLSWQCRDPSPFMSTTTDPFKAAGIASCYQRDGFKNIEVLIIQVGETDWPTGSIMWHVRETAAALGLDGVLSNKHFDDYEYLIENQIPQACVTRLRWEDVIAGIDAEPHLMDQSSEKEPVVSGSGGSEAETHVSDGRKGPRSKLKLRQALADRIAEQTRVLLHSKRRQRGFGYTLSKPGLGNPSKQWDDRLMRPFKCFDGYQCPESSLALDRNRWIRYK